MAIKQKEATAAPYAENMEKKVRLLPVSLFLLVPTMYVFGRSYRGAWLAQYGLSELTFPASVDEAVYSSYEAVLWLGVAAIPWLAKAGLMLGALLLLWLLSGLLLLVWNSVGGLVKRGLVWVVSEAEGFLAEHRKRLELPAKAYGIAAIPFLLWGGVLYAFLLLFVPLMLGHYIGEWQGQRSYAELRQRIATGAFKDGEQVIVLAEGQGTFRLVACGDLGCAGADTHGTRFVRWELIDQIVEGKRVKGKN